MIYHFKILLLTCAEYYTLHTKLFKLNDLDTNNEVFIFKQNPEFLALSLHHYYRNYYLVDKQSENFPKFYVLIVESDSAIVHELINILEEKVSYLVACKHGKFYKLTISYSPFDTDNYVRILNELTEISQDDFYSGLEQ